MAVFADPKLVVILGYRAILSLIGLTTVLIGYWISQKRWDETGSAAYTKAAENVASGDYQVVDSETGKAAAAVVVAAGETPPADGSGTTLPPPSSAGGVIVPVEDLKEAAPIPKIMFAGTIVFALSFFYLPKRGFELYMNGWNTGAAILIILTGILVGFPLRQASINRDAGLRRRTSVLVILLYWLFAFMTWCDANFIAPWYTLFFAGILFFLAYQLVRRSRKMGVTWDEEGKPATNVPTQNYGFIVLLLASFLLWLGVNAVPFVYAEADFVDAYIPLYGGARTWIVFLAGTLIILPSELALDRAFDEGASFEGGFGLSGDAYLPLAQRFKYFDISEVVGRLQTPFFYLGGWTLLAITQYMPFFYGHNSGRLISFLLCLLTGSIYAFKVLPSYWTGYPGLYNKWNMVYCASFLLLALFIGIHSWISCVLAFAGVFFIIGGQHIDMYDRKRGYFWINARNTNPRPSVFGFGQPIHVTGWIFLSLAMSSPY